MVLDKILELLYNVISGILNLIPQLPAMPDSVSTSVTNFIDLIFQHAGFLGFFFNLTLIKVFLPLAFMLLIVKYTIKLIFFIMAKIPFIAAG